MTEKCKGNDRKVNGKLEKIVRNWEKSLREMTENCKGNERKV